MKANELKIGTKLVLRIGGNRDKPSLKLVSKLEWVEDEDSAYIAAPIHAGIVYPIHVDTVMDVFFIHKIDSRNLDLFSFKAKVSERLQKDNLPILKINIVSDMTRMQRRQYYRHECSIPIEYRSVPDETLKDGNEEEFKKAVTRDLSGGGLCFVTDDKIEADIMLECRLTLSENHKINFTGIVVRRDLLEIADAFRYSIGIRFKNINHRDRESVIRYIFKEQRKLRQKGLI